MEEKYLSIYYDDKTINKTLNNKKRFGLWMKEFPWMATGKNEKFSLPINFLCSVSKEKSGGGVGDEEQKKDQQIINAKT